jgi:hypothetical protein
MIAILSIKFIFMTVRKEYLLFIQIVQGSKIELTTIGQREIWMETETGKEE